MGPGGIQRCWQGAAGGLGAGPLGKPQGGDTNGTGAAGEGDTSSAASPGQQEEALGRTAPSTSGGGIQFPHSPSIQGAQGLKARGFRWTRGLFHPLPTRSLPGDPKGTSWREPAGCWPGRSSPSLGAGPAELRRRPPAPAPRTHPPAPAAPPQRGEAPAPDERGKGEGGRPTAAGFPHAPSQRPGCNALRVRNPIADSGESPPDASSRL